MATIYAIISPTIFSDRTVMLLQRPPTLMGLNLSAALAKQSTSLKGVRNASGRRRTIRMITRPELVISTPRCAHDF
ncbi:MAG: hypothetical protein N3G20_10000 [Verrucomicrobiae bacterium]|nr:hypothetical protein [Verrucomicrobiae bacterium]